MFRSHDESPYGLLDSVSILFNEIDKPLISDYVVGEISYCKGRLPIFSGNLFIVKPIKKQKVKNEDTVFNSSYVDLDVLRKRDDVEEKPYLEPSRFKYEREEPENVIKIDKRDLAKFNKILDQETKAFDSMFVSKYIPKLLGIEHASARTEAFVRDGLGIDGFNIDNNLLPYIKNGIKVDFVASVIMDLPNIPVSVKEAYLSGLVQDAIATSKNQVREASMLDYNMNRYRPNLDNPVGQIKQTSIGTLRSRKKNEKETGTENKNKQQ
jgi:hypothetical protein